MTTYAYDPRYIANAQQGLPSHVTAVVHKQYNSPMPLYSMENIASTLATQAEVLTNGAVGVDFHAIGTPVLKRSEVYRLLQEQERRGGVAHPAVVQQQQYRAPERQAEPAKHRQVQFQHQQQQMSSTSETTATSSGEESDTPATFQSQSFIRIQKNLQEDNQPTSPVATVLQDPRKQAQPNWSAAPHHHPTGPPPDTGDPRAQHRQQPQQQQPAGDPRYYQQQKGGQVPPQHQQQQQQQHYRPPAPPQAEQPKHRQVQFQQPQVQQQVQQQVPRGGPEPADPRGQPQYLPPRAPDAAQQYVRAAEGSSANHLNSEQRPLPSPLPRKQWPPASNSTGNLEPREHIMADASPRSQRRNIWPPPITRQGLQTSTQSIHWAASNASKKFIWPPPKEYTSYEYDEYSRAAPDAPPSRDYAQQRADGFLPGPTRVPARGPPRNPSKLGAQAWQPYTNVLAEDEFVACAVPGRRVKRFEEVIHHSNATRLPPTYRPPPGTQHITLSY